jgi:hypothetical protein
LGRFEWTPEKKPAAWQDCHSRRLDGRSAYFLLAALPVTAESGASLK